MTSSDPCAAKSSDSKPPAAELSSPPSQSAPVALACGLSSRDLLLAAWGFIPLLAAFFVNLWSHPQYRFFPLALAGAGFLAWERVREKDSPLSPGAPLPVAVAMAMALCILSVAVLLWSPWLGCIAAIVAATGVVWWLGGWNLFRTVLPAVVVAATVVPPPLALDTRMTLFLRSVAINFSSKMLDILGVTHALSGNVIELPGQKLLVEEACSGINSVLLVTTVTLFYLFWRKRGLWCFLFCLPVNLGFVLMGNVARIVAGAWLRFFHGIDILSGTVHTLIGLFLTGTYLILIPSMEHLLYVRKTRADRPEADREAAPDKTPIAPKIPPVWGAVVGYVFGILGIVELGRGWMFYHEHREVAAASQVMKGAAFGLPEQIGPWKRLDLSAPSRHIVETGDICSQVWSYRKGNVLAAISFDYPFRGYHDVTICYETNGWALSGRHRLAPQSGAPPSVEVGMFKDPDVYAMLWFSTIDEHGRWIEAPAVQRSLLDRWRIPGTNEATSYRVQLLETDFVPVAPEDRNAGYQLFEECRGLLARQLMQRMAFKP